MDARVSVPRRHSTPPKVTNRPEKTWGKLTKGKDGTDKLSTAKIKRENPTIRLCRHNK